MPMQAKIIVFSQPGCPACEDYTPRFERIAQTQKTPSRVLDINSPEGDKLSDDYGIDSTPTTVVFFQRARPIKVTGAVSDSAIKQLFAMV